MNELAKGKSQVCVCVCSLRMVGPVVQIPVFGLMELNEYVIIRVNVEMRTRSRFKNMSGHVKEVYFRPSIVYTYIYLLLCSNRRRWVVDVSHMIPVHNRPSYIYGDRVYAHGDMRDGQAIERR